MTKEETMAELRKDGFVVELVDNAIMLSLFPDRDEDITDRFTARLKELGYNASFGWRGAPK